MTDKVIYPMKVYPLLVSFSQITIRLNGPDKICKFPSLGASSSNDVASVGDSWM
jgi:hypothetical protein